MSKQRTKPVPTAKAVAMGYSADRRKRKRQHRRAAKKLLTGGFFNANSAPGSTHHAVAQWHLAQARALS